MMRKMPIAALLAALTLVACQKKQVAVDKNLSKDLDLASSAADHLSLPPSGPPQLVESPIERSLQAREKRLATKTVQVQTVHQRLRKLRSPQVALTPTAAIVTPSRPFTAVAPRPQVIPTVYPASAPAVSTAPAGRGHEDDGISPNGDYGGRGRGGWGVVVRGGTVDGDHCEPRESVNNQMPGVRQMPGAYNGRF